MDNLVLALHLQEHENMSEFIEFVKATPICVPISYVN